MIKRSLKVICIIYTLIFSFSNLVAENDNSIIGYWLTSQSIVLVKECDDGICATIEHIFVEEGVDQNSILDSNNKEKALRDRSLVGVNLISNFEYVEGTKQLSGGKIYDPGRGRTFKSNISLLQNGNLKVEGCLLRMCGHEEWRPLNVTFNEDGSRQALLKE